MTDATQTPEEVALTLTHEIMNYERNYEEDAKPSRDYVLSLYEECLNVVKGYARNADKEPRIRVL